MSMLSETRRRSMTAVECASAIDEGIPSPMDSLGLRLLMFSACCRTRANVGPTVRRGLVKHAGNGRLDGMIS